MSSSLYQIIKTDTMKIKLFFCFLISVTFIKAQTTEKTYFTYGEFKSGYGITRFGNGLKEKYNAGNFSASGGGLTTLAAYKKFQKINNINLGLKFKGLGAAPAIGDNNQEMFFNFWAVAFALKYFPLKKEADQGIYLQADFNFVTQFTQKYRNTASLDFYHQFAIGNSYTIGIGYQHKFSKQFGMVTSLEYDRASRTGEVQGVGEKNFKNTHIAAQIGIIF
jgi:hypothetical protein